MMHDDQRASATRRAITFDNMGEAAELDMGIWPHGVPLGQHYSVTKGLPRILAKLSASNLRATFFIEASNVHIYPKAIRAIEEGGHEVALHAWRHEQWSSLTLNDQQENLKRCVTAFKSLGINLKGFRPPGGGIDELGLKLLIDLGFTYVSPVSTVTANVPGLVKLPFEWGMVDAALREPELRQLRLLNMGSTDVRPLEEWTTALSSLFDKDGPLLSVSHSYLMENDPAIFDVFETFCERASGQPDRFVTCVELAELLRPN